jgi:hypothetical protein
VQLEPHASGPDSDQHLGSEGIWNSKLRPEDASVTTTLTPARLFVRCFAESFDDDRQWQAFSLEFGLAAQGASMGEVKAKLEAMIQDYLYDALAGEDREHAHELLTRRAHWRIYARYYTAVALHNIWRSMSSVKIFSESVPLIPGHCG